MRNSLRNPRRLQRGAIARWCVRRWGRSTRSLATRLLIWLASLTSKVTGLGAAEFFQRSTSIIKRRAVRRLTGGRGETSGVEAQRSALRFSALVKTTHRLVAEGRDRTTALSSRDVRDRAVGARLGSRGLACADGGAVGQGLASACRARARAAGLGERMAGEGQAAHRGQERGRRRSAKPDAEKALADRLAAIDTRLAEIDQRARPGLPGLRRAGEPSTRVRRGGAGPARRR